MSFRQIPSSSRSSTPSNAVVAVRSSSPQAAAPTTHAEALRHLHKTEKIVRLEVHRRSIRSAVNLHDDMIADLDAQLTYVADFKREWYNNMKVLEQARQDLMHQGLVERSSIEGEWFDTLDLVVQDAMADHRHASARSQHHRRNR